MERWKNGIMGKARRTTIEKFFNPSFHYSSLPIPYMAKDLRDMPTEHKVKTERLQI
jgi:hypothetical protein